jgi:hypothetical protein
VHSNAPHLRLTPETLGLLRLRARLRNTSRSSSGRQERPIFAFQASLGPGGAWDLERAAACWEVLSRADLPRDLVGWVVEGEGEPRAYRLRQWGVISEAPPPALLPEDWRLRRVRQASSPYHLVVVCAVSRRHYMVMPGMTWDTERRLWCLRWDMPRGDVADKVAKVEGTWPFPPHWAVAPLPREWQAPPSNAYHVIDPLPPAPPQQPPAAAQQGQH